MNDQWKFIFHCCDSEHELSPLFFWGNVLCCFKFFWQLGMLSCSAVTPSFARRKKKKKKKMTAVAITIFPHGWFEASVNSHYPPPLSVAVLVSILAWLPVLSPRQSEVQPMVHYTGHRTYTDSTTRDSSPKHHNQTQRAKQSNVEAGVHFLSVRTSGKIDGCAKQAIRLQNGSGFTRAELFPFYSNSCQTNSGTAQSHCLFLALLLTINWGKLGSPAWAHVDY